MRFIDFDRESVRFVLAGGFNTVATYLAYLALLPFTGYAIAFSLSYVAGIALGYYLSARFVFNRPLRWQDAMRYPLVYVVQYLVGLGLTAALIEGLHFSAEITPVLVTLLTLPITFWLARWIIKREHTPSEEPRAER